jgi:hypothetical protein
MRFLLALLFVFATNAFAVSKGGKLYIKSKDTKVRKDAKPEAPAVVTVQRGKEVIWLGASEKNKEWHEISVDGKKGFVRLSDLSPYAPMQEISLEGKPVASELPFAESGYAKCTFGASVPAKSGSPAEQEARAELIYLEELNRAQGTAVLDAKSKELQHK